MKKENIDFVQLIFDAIGWKKKDEEDQLVIQVPPESDYEQIRASGHYPGEFRVKVPLTRNGNIYEISFRLGVCKEDGKYFIVKDGSIEADYTRFEMMKIGVMNYSTWLCTARVDIDSGSLSTTIEPEYIRGEDLDLANSITPLFTLDIRATNVNKREVVKAG